MFLLGLVSSGVLSDIDFMGGVDGQQLFKRHRVDRGTASQSACNLYRCFDYDSDSRASRLALHLTSAAGPEIVVIDLGSGKVVARVRLKPE